tara:strand:+ start:1676 stop:1963 length:288 start_codon:yes stop_codon:yes gene_type:complete
MQSMEEVTLLIKDVGFPIAAAVGAGAAVWFMISWLKSSLVSKLDANNAMIIKLIDRCRALDNSIVRLELLMRLMNDLPPDWERTGKLDPEDRRKD